MQLTEETTLRELFRMRPRAVETLEYLSGSRCWRRLSDSILDFCFNEGLDASVLLPKLSSLEPAAAGGDWMRRPLYDLVDHLTENHRIYREKALPALEAVAFEDANSNSEEKEFLREMSREILDFTVDFDLHMEEEESFLFPKALRTEACVRHPDLTPEIFTGSASVYPPAMLHVPEEQVGLMVANLRRRVKERGGRPAIAALALRIDRALRALEQDIEAHADLETGALLPRVMRMEHELADRIEREQDASV